MLGGLPLAIAQAAIHIKQTRIQLAGYIRRYENAKLWPQVVGASGRDRPLRGYENAVGVTWSLSLERVRELEPVGPVAVNLVQTWAFLDNKDLWYGLFEDIVDLPACWFSGPPDSEDLTVMGKERWFERWNCAQLPDWLVGLQASEATFHEAIQLLLAYHLIEPQELDAGTVRDENSSAQGGYSMHPVVHTWAARTQSEEQKASSSRTALSLFYTGVSLWSDWTKRRRFWPHGNRAIANYIASNPKPEEDDNTCDSLRTMCAFVRLGDLYHDSDKVQAIAILKRVLKCKKLPWKVRSTALSYLNSSLLNMFRYPESEKYCKERMSLCIEAAGEGHSHSIEATLQLGTTYSRRGKLPEARAIYRKVVDAFHASSKTSLYQRKLCFTAIRRLGASYAEEGQLDEAKRWYKKAEEMHNENATPKWERRAAFLWEDIGRLYMITREYAFAREYFHRAWESALTTYGPGATLTEGMALMMAETCREMRQFVEAAQWLDQMPRRMAPRLMERLAHGYFALGCSVVEAGDVEFLLQSDSERIVRNALREVLRILGRDYEEIQGLYEKLTLLYSLQGRQDAIETLEQQWTQGSID